MILNLTKADLKLLTKDNAENVKAYIQHLIAKELKKSNKTPKKNSTNKVKKIYQTDATERRKKLVENQTNAEKLIKAKLKSLCIEYEFQKIIPIDYYYYIVDFYLPKYDLILEIDGGYHDTTEQIHKDKVRTSNLRLNGYTKLKRLTNQRALEITTNSLKNLIESK